MKTPEEISKDIRDEFFRTRYGSSIGRQLTGDALDAAIVGAVSPLCQHIDTLQDALRGVLRRSEEYPGYILHPEHEARLRSILGDSDNA